jgi:MHS family proline/betaine transporter-like MFS transporter
MHIVDSKTKDTESGSLRKIAIGAGGGTVIEFYDFSVYGYLAIVISPLFFPSAHPVTSLLTALAVFGTAYFMRPLGAVFFGYLGDRKGRKVSLMASLFIMGAASTLMGLLPTFSQIGVWAPILLVLTRLLQGFSAGGENGGAATFISESVPKNKRATYGSVIGVGGTAGFALAAGAAGAMTALLGAEQMAAWGWRVPFLLSLPLTLFCFWIRRHLEETFEAKSGTKEGVPLVQLFQSHLRSVVQVVLLAVSVNGASYFGFTYLSIHLIQRLEYPSASVYWVATGAIGLSSIFMPLTGRLADRVGSLPVATIGLVGYAVLTYPAMALMSQGIGMAFLGFILIMINTAFLQVAVFTLVPRLFAPKVRYTGVAFSYNIGVMAAGGSAPFLCVWLIESTGNVMAPAFFVIGAAILGLLAVSWIRRTGEEVSHNVEEEVRSAATTVG